MTGLQKALSKIRNTEELASLLGISESSVVREIAITRDNELMKCEQSQCVNCVASGTDISCYDSIRNYLNAELSEKDSKPSTKPNCSTEIIEMRKNARVALLSFLKKRFLANADAEGTGLLISHHISLLETIGLFQHDELRNEFIEYLEKLA